MRHCKWCNWANRVGVDFDSVHMGVGSTHTQSTQRTATRWSQIISQRIALDLIKWHTGLRQAAAHFREHLRFIFSFLFSISLSESCRCLALTARKTQPAVSPAIFTNCCISPFIYAIKSLTVGRHCQFRATWHLTLFRFVLHNDLSKLQQTGRAESVEILQPLFSSNKHKPMHE